MKRRTMMIIGAAILAVSAIGYGTVSTATSLTDESSLPTAPAERGPLSLNVNARGELRAMRTVPVSVPAVGGSLRILEIVPSGTRVQPGDVILRFDPIDQQYRLQQALSQLEEAEQEIVRLKANAAVQAAQAEVDLLTARFDVRRATLDIRGDADLVAANERKKFELTLEEAKRRLAQLEQDVKSRAVTSAADLAVQTERLNRERLDAAEARRNIEDLTVRSEIGGLVVVRQNRDAAGGFFFSGMTLPEYKAGDTVNSRRAILDIYDISELEVRTRIDEHQRDNVKVGQPAMVSFDAIPGLDIAAQVVSVANLATRSPDAPGPIRQFDATLRLDSNDPRLRPGGSTRILLKGETVPEAIFLPRTALFEKDGNPIVYVRKGEFFEATRVKVTYRTETHTAVEGIDEGTEVSLVNPERDQTRNATGSGAPAAGGGGGEAPAPMRGGGGGGGRRGGGR